MAEITSKQWGRIYAHAWQNPDFKHKLEQDPKAAIEEVAKRFGLHYDRIATIPDPPGDLTGDAITEIANGNRDIHYDPPKCC